jgi:drug/metabolite transporter (DMT)-like permease
MKFGVMAVPAIWFGALRYMIGSSILFAILASRRASRFPARRDWVLVLVSGGLQMAAFSALTGLALTILPPGRASVLAYSTPLWVVPIAAWRLGEAISSKAVLGVGCGLIGVLVIASPSLNAHVQLAGYAMLIMAAACWAVSIVYVRGHRFVASPLELAPWQMLVAALLLLPIAAVSEGALGSINLTGIAALAYVGPIATAFAYWAVVDVGRRFRAATLSMALLATPILGILFSSILTGEVIDASLILATLLIALGIRLAAASQPRREHAHHGSRSHRRLLPERAKHQAPE